MADENMPQKRRIVTRLEALERGLRFYFTGKPCKRGHLAERRPDRRHCVVCVHEYATSEDQRAKTRERYLRGGDEARTRAKRWAVANPELHKAAVKAWTKRNPQKTVEYVNKRRALKANNGGSHTAEEITAPLKAQGFRCSGCGCSLKRRFEVDHIMPLSRGGSNDISNIQLLCVSCNRSKGARHPIEWAQRNGRLL